MKGMLTGPVTILAWSFVRDDQPLGETAKPGGPGPARRDRRPRSLPASRSSRLTSPPCANCSRCARADQPAYLDWSVNSFRLATAGAADATQIHTHLCYSEFGVIIDAIDGPRRRRDLDRSRPAPAWRLSTTSSPTASAAASDPAFTTSTRRASRARQEVTELLSTAVKHVPSRQLWVNPDCGLKTRGYAETDASLRNLVAATKTVRAELLEGAKK
jgi:5-methyltetrahydropteroyltriglutamate--homocysteine methyltransferase